MPFTDEDWGVIKGYVEANQQMLLVTGLADRIEEVLKAEFGDYGVLFDHVCERLDAHPEINDPEALKDGIRGVLCSPVILRAIVGAMFLRLVRTTGVLCECINNAAGDEPSSLSSEVYGAVLRTIQCIQIIQLFAVASVCKGDCANCPIAAQGAACPRPGGPQSPIPFRPEGAESVAEFEIGE